MNFSRGKQSVSELLKNCFIEANAALEIFERKIFIRRMCAAIRQRESHQQGFDAKNAAKLRHNRDAAAFADERGVAVERFTQRALRGFTQWRVRIGEIPRPAVAG